MSKIWELPTKTTLQNTDLLVIEDPVGRHTYQMTYQKFLEIVPMVSTFTKNDATGELTITLTNGQTLKIVPHDPTKQDKELSTPIIVDETSETTVEDCLAALNTYIGTKQNALTFDNVPTASSNNPVKSGGIYSAIQDEVSRATEAEGDKVDKVAGKGLSTEDYTTVEKTKLSGIEAEANKTVVDAELSPTSTNPVQNKAVYAAIMNQDEFLLSQLDGTVTTYRKVMKKWFDYKGVSGASVKKLNELCDEWYEKTRPGWDGRTKFAQPSVTAVSTGTKEGDNANMVCIPSTDVTAGQDDYAGNNLFAITRVNWIVDETTLDPIVTAIEGITEGFEADNPDKYVGIMQMTGYVYFVEDTNDYSIGYADTPVSSHTGIAPLEEAVRCDGTIRNFVLHSAYMSGINGEKMTACSGQKVSAWNSHNSLHTFSGKNGAQYSGGCTCDDAFLKIMTFIKYASLTLDNIMAGCNNYNGVYYAQVSETGVKRVIVPNNTIIEPGSVVEIGVYNGSSADRGTAANYSISGNRGCKVLSVETVTINDTTYKAVYVDIDTAFDTVANGSAVSGSTIIQTWHWATGSCDAVKGNDGSPVSNTDNKHPFKLQGIECMVGGYEVLADVIMSIEKDGSDNSRYIPYITKRKSYQATSITANYEGLTGLAIYCPATDSWQYIKKLKYEKGVYYPNVVGGSSSTYTRDAMYMNKNSTTGTREWLACGYLTAGAVAGLSSLSGTGLSNASWNCLARLSPNGNRGELSA